MYILYYCKTLAVEVWFDAGSCFSCCCSVNLQYGNSKNNYIHGRAHGMPTRRTDVPPRKNYKIKNQPVSYHRLTRILARDVRLSTPAARTRNESAAVRVKRAHTENILPRGNTVAKRKIYIFFIFKKTLKKYNKLYVRLHLLCVLPGRVLPNPIVPQRRIPLKCDFWLADCKQPVEISV